MKVQLFIWLISVTVKGFETERQEVISLIKRVIPIFRIPILLVLIFIIMSITQEEMILSLYFT